jgi:hypothetical protein
MSTTNFGGTLTAVSLEESVNTRHVGDEPYKRAVKGIPRTLIVVFHAWSSDMGELENYPLLATMDNYVMICPNAGGQNNHPQGAGHPAQLERVKRVIDAVRLEFPMIERVLGMGTSGGGYMGLMFMAAYPGLIYGASLWVFPYDLADWWQQKSQFRSSLEACMGGTPSQVPVEYLARSPMSRTIAGAVLYLNGSEDDIQVPFAHQQAAKNRFETANTVTFRNFSGGHITQWPEAAAQLQSMFPSYN